eukprot:3921299-Amphidinium_carterae.1
MHNDALPESQLGKKLRNDLVCVLLDEQDFHEEALGAVPSQAERSSTLCGEQAHRVHRLPHTRHHVCHLGFIR